MRFRPLLALILFLLAQPAQAMHAVSTLSLRDGAAVWYVRNDTLPIVDILLSFEGAGSAGDPSGREGRAAFAAAMLTEGTKDHDALAFARALEDRAITLETRVSEDRLTVHVRCLREEAKEAGKLLAAALLTPRFAEEDIARIRDVTMTRLALLEEDPDYLADRLFDAKAFTRHPYAHSPYGTKAGVAALEERDLRAYMEGLSRANLLVTAAGDVDDALLQSVLQPLLSALPDGRKEKAAVAQTSMQGAGAIYHETHTLPQSTVMFGAPAVERSDKRFYAAYLLNQILGGPALTSRLADTIRIQQGLVYGVGSALDVRAGSTLLRGSLATATATTDTAIEAVKATLKAMQEHGVSRAECEEARTYVLGSYLLDLDSSNRLASALLVMRVHGLGEDYLEKRTEYFKEVACEDVSALAKELLDPERFLFVTVGAKDPQAKDTP